jgi:hypothetical protein
MYAMHEVLARERMRDMAERSQRQELADQLAKSRRWRVRELRARAAYKRYSQRAHRTAQSSAMVEAR